MPRGFGVNQIAEALRKAGGIHADAAKLLQEEFDKPCSRSNVSHYVRRHPELQDVIKEIKEETKDLCESELMKMIRAGDRSAIFFYLKCQAKERGYVERSELTGKDGGPVETREKPDLGKLSDEDLRELRRIASNAA